MNDRREQLRWMISQRAELLRELRVWFDGRGFCEVQPACLSRECIIDVHIDPIPVHGDQLRLSDSVPDRYFLQTSPEAAMKRLLAEGAPSIYSLGPTFRGGERGAEHNIEFTMLEWYELSAGIDEEVQRLGQLACDILGREGFDERNYRTLFQEHLGFDPIHGELKHLAECVAQFDEGLATSLGSDRDGLLETLWSQSIQPKLGIGRPIVVRNYPLSQAALARVADDDTECAARFELFVDGVELANGYHELGDAEILRERFEDANRQREQIGKETLPLPEQFLRAMEIGLPPCSGVALGVDRLLMVRTGRDSIADVLPYPIEFA
ncbi:MAG: EF-P lysine aminoacylase EpmA [Planctomycetota bacterium]